MNIGKFYCGLLLFLAISCEVVQESSTPTKRGKALSLSERANQSYYKAVDRARKLQQVLAKRRMGIDDPADMYFMNNKKLFKYTWYNGRYVRMPELMNPGLSDMLNQLSKSHKTPLNKSHKKDAFVPLVPLYDRFAPKKHNSSQMQCSLNVSFIPMRHYLKIGVLVLLAEFTSSCRTDAFKKYFWIHTWNPASYFVIQIASKQFVFSWMKPERAHDTNLLFIEYQTVKMLNEFQAVPFSLDPRTNEMIDDGDLFPQLKKMPKPIKSTKSSQRKKRPSPNPKSSKPVIRAMKERILSDRTYDDEPRRSYRPLHRRRMARGYPRYRPLRRAESRSRARGLRRRQRPNYDRVKRIRNHSYNRSRSLRRRAYHSRRRPQRYLGDYTRRGHYSSPRMLKKLKKSNKKKTQSKNNKKSQGNQTEKLQTNATNSTPVIDERDEYRRKISPSELPHRDPRHPLSQNYIEENEENPHNADNFVDPQDQEEHEHDTKKYPWSSGHSNARLKARGIGAREHFKRKSFKTLESRNPALRVKIREIKDPYDFFPNLAPKDPNLSVFFLPANDRRPFWELAAIDRIWTGVNPQICNAKYVHNIRNSHINCVL
jgi:hypothetical protein